jgi:translation initiation factor RLI1
MAQIAMDTVLRTFDGDAITEVVKVNDKTAPKEYTLLRACCDALLEQDINDLSGDDKVKRYILAKKISRKGIVTLKAEEVSLLKDLIGKRFYPVIVAQAWAILDPVEQVSDFQNGGSDEY